MSASDNIESVLRDIHILISKAKPIDVSGNNVVINKNTIMQLLQNLNDAMYGLQEEYELTQNAKEKAMREFQKQCDDMTFQAQRQANDIYAASIMYAEASLTNLQNMYKDREAALDAAYEAAKEQIKIEDQRAKTAQINYKSALNNLIDSQKYLRLIDKENARLLRGEPIDDENTPDEVVHEEETYSAPEIRINKEYFEANGIPIEEDSAKNTQSENDMEVAANSLSDDLDAEYFSWKDEQQEEEKPKKGRKTVKLFSKKD